MNIREHIQKSIYGGMDATMTADGTQAGVIFHDEEEFIAFSDLGYSQEIGYYRLSQFPDRASECSNENPETIHRGEWHEPWNAYVWMDADGYPHLLGETWQVADLYQALRCYLEDGVLDADSIHEDDPAWGMHYTIADAVAEAVEYGWPNDEQTANSIRTAARAGRIPGAKQDSGNRWLLHKRRFRDWLMSSQPRRKESA